MSIPFFMLFPTNRPRGEARASTVQQLTIIHVALALGVVMFAAVALFIGPSIAAGNDGEAGPAGSNVLVWVAVGHAGLAPILAAVLFRALAGRVRGDRGAALELIEKGKVPPAMATASIVAAAVLESAGLLATIALMLTGAAWLVAIPAGAVVGILLLIPNERRTRGVIEGLD